MILNKIEIELKNLYDSWNLGNTTEHSPNYSSMFRMGFPEEYIDSKKPLLMYVGQECLRCGEEKTQVWVREYQNVQRTKNRITTDWFDFGTNNSPFWNFYRQLSALGYNSLWNNLDKFHPLDAQRLSWEDGVKFNSPYGDDNLSILQREIKLLKPKVVIFSIGNGKYTSSLSAAFSVDETELKKFAPTVDEPVKDISNLLKIPNTIAIWTYHPAYLQRSKNYNNALLCIKELTKINSTGR